MRSRLVGLSLPTLTALGACFVAGCDNHATTPTSLGTRITWSFCANGTGDLAEPTWLAVQDGTEPWTRVQPAADGSFSFTITHGVGGVAWTSVAATGGTTSTLTVVHGTTQELSQSPSVL